VFIKVPVYFELEGIAPNQLGFLQENLAAFVEKSLLGRAQKVLIGFSKKELQEVALPEGSTVHLVRRSRVLDGIR
jgi:hypothetical protein